MNDIAAVDARDDAALEEWYAVYRAADTHGRRWATPWMLPELRASFTGTRTGEEHRPVTLRRGDDVVACGVLELPLKDNLQLAHLGVWTHPDHRGRGHGTALLEHLTELARDRGRTVLHAEVFVPYDGAADGTGHPDADWAHRRGFALDIRNVVRALELPADADHLRRLAEEAAPHHRGYALRTFAGPVPDDIVLEFGRLVGSLMVEAPSGQVVKEQEVMDLERIRADEAVFAASGRAKYTTVAVAPDGALAAYTELVVPRHDPGHVFQWGTLVRPEHRGHRLGMATKVHNLRWLQSELSGPATLFTCNAEVNRHMVAVNEALGFRAVEREVELVRSL